MMAGQEPLVDKQMGDKHDGDVSLMDIFGGTQLNWEVLGNLARDSPSPETRMVQQEYKISKMFEAALTNVYRCLTFLSIFCTVIIAVCGALISAGDQIKAVTGWMPDPHIVGMIAASLTTIQQASRIDSWQGSFHTTREILRLKGKTFMDEIRAINKNKGLSQSDRADELAAICKKFKVTTQQQWIIQTAVQINGWLCCVPPLPVQLNRRLTSEQTVLNTEGLTQANQDAAGA